MAQNSTLLDHVDLITHPIGIACIVIFALAYVVVMLEEKLHLRKSKPVTLAAGLIWAIIAAACVSFGVDKKVLEVALDHYLLEFAELFLFLLVAMAYINTLQERRVFDVLQARLVNRGYGYRAFFWVTGVLSFFISAVADNLTTALVMCAISVAVGKGNPRFVAIACVNVVVASNAGGAFSPFGDITTLMVWQKGHVDFFGFFALFVPSLVNWLVPAVFMFMAVPNEKPEADHVYVTMERGAKRVMFLFALTIATAVIFHSVLHLPPAMGMMTGLAYLKLFGYYLRKRLERKARSSQHDLGEMVPFDIFRKIAKAEWDTLLFFYGVIMCVGGLSFLGYLSLMSEAMYDTPDPTIANVMVGVLSAVVDNIPVMIAVLGMEPDLNHAQWLLVTLAAGVGGSLLSVGSAAGVAVMGMARGQYTFMSHLRWTPVIALGYAASIFVHIAMHGT